MTDFELGYNKATKDLQTKTYDQCVDEMIRVAIIDKEIAKGYSAKLKEVNNK